MPNPGASYRGRFAPSPSGPLHLGSLIAALASFLDARHNAGTWLVRMDDLDPPREQPGAASSILRSLESHGLLWDEEVMWQSQRGAAYEEALSNLYRNGRIFICDCSRQALGPGGSCGNRCQGRPHEVTAPWATRITVEPESLIEFDDSIQGRQSSGLNRELEDFVVKRKDGFYAYQLAVVVDDASQGINHIVRGSDLMASTARQIYLQRTLGLPTPGYAHLPVITNTQGQKFSKQNHAPALRDDAAPQNLRRALAFLQQPQPPADLSDTASILSMACKGWSIERVPRTVAIPATVIDGPI